MITLWLVALFMGTTLSSWKDRHLVVPTNVPVSPNDALIGLVGEFRTVLARYLWFKVDLYHEMAEQQGEKAEAEIVPLMRLVTVLDPTMLETYDQIAWDLYKNFNEKKTAINILDEGLARNPKSFQLNFRKAFLEYAEKNYEPTRRFASIALMNTQDRFEQLDALRLIYWSAKKDHIKELQQRAIADILRLSPGDPVYTRELEELNSEKKK